MDNPFRQMLLQNKIILLILIQKLDHSAILFDIRPLLYAIRCSSQV